MAVSEDLVVHGLGTLKKILIHRSDFQNLTVVSNDLSPINYLSTDIALPEDLAIVKSNASGTAGNLVYAASRRLVAMGNTMTDSTSGEHVFRSQWMDRAVIAHNHFADCADFKSVVTLRAPIGRLRRLDHQLAEANGQVEAIGRGRRLLH